jgi:hypothetical protein
MHQTVILLKIIIKDSDNYCNVLFAPLHSVVIASLLRLKQFITITTAHPWEVSYGALAKSVTPY